MLTLAKHSISLYVGSSGRCSTAWGQNEIFCQSKVLFPLVHACYKNLQHRSKHNPIIWAWRNRAKLNFLSDIHWLNDIEPLIALCSFSLCMCNMFCFLWPSWMKFLRYAYIYISYRWDLAAISLATSIRGHDGTKNEHLLPWTSHKSSKSRAHNKPIPWINVY